MYDEEVKLKTPAECKEIFNRMTKPTHLLDYELFLTANELKSFPEGKLFWEQQFSTQA